MQAIANPFEVFHDKSGDPLDAGYVYIGASDLNPETNPVTVYWDETGTQPAEQPLRTLNGYIVRAGTPARVYVSADDFSMTCKEKNGVIIFYERSVNAPATLRMDLADEADPTKGASLVGYNPALAYLSGLGEFLNYTFGRTDGEIAAAVTPTNWAYPPGDPRRFGAAVDGVTLDTDALTKTIMSSLKVYIPEGTMLIGPPTPQASLYTLLYLGVNNGQPNRRGLTVRGEGKSSIIKLADNAGRGALLFGGGNSDSLYDMTFRDFVIDLNGANNLQTSFADPYRYSNAFYLSSYCENLTFQNLTIKNASGAQPIRVGNDTSAGYGKNIRVLFCDFDRFGVGLEDNFMQDCSCCYIQADGILVQGCTFIGKTVAAFDYARGHTALELHGDSSTMVVNNRFRYIKAPILVASSQKPTTNFLIQGNSMFQCGFMTILDPATYDQKRIRVQKNVYYSTIHASSINLIGMSGEAAKTREDIAYENNVVMCFGNTNQDIHFIRCENIWLKSISVNNNKLAGFYGSAFYLNGPILEDGLMEINVCGNDLDSLGSNAGVYPNSPTFVHIEPTAGVVLAVNVSQNKYRNTSGLDYSVFGMARFSGSISYLFCEGNKSLCGTTYPMVYDVSTGAVVKRIDYRTNGGALNVPNIVLMPAASVTPANNGEVTFQLTSNTQLTVKAKGSDGVVRSGSLALA